MSSLSDDRRSAGAGDDRNVRFVWDLSANYQRDCLVSGDGGDQVAFGQSRGRKSEVERVRDVVQHGSADGHQRVAVERQLPGVSGQAIELVGRSEGKSVGGIVRSQRGAGQFPQPRADRAG